MAMSTPNPPDGTDRSLDCGRDPIEVVDRARSGRSTSHEQGCPFCQAAIEADGVARTAATELVAAERENRVPDTLLPNIMSSVWSDLRRSTMIPLATDTGSAFVADHTIAAVIEYALDQLTDLRIHTCAARLMPAEPNPVSAPAAAGTIAIEVTAAAAYNTDVRAVATQVRELARSTVAEQFGWAAEPVDIDIVDVYLTEDADR